MWIGLAELCGHQEATPPNKYKLQSHRNLSGGYCDPNANKAATFVAPAVGLRAPLVKL